MPQLDYITIKGYKSIRELNNFQLKALNILIGANGAGKSNFVMLFELLHQIVSENLQLTVARSGGANSFLHFGQKVTEEIGLELRFGNNSYKLKLVPAEGDILIFSEETVWNGKFGSGHRESLLKKNAEKVDNLCWSCAIQPEINNCVLKSINSWQVYHFHDTSSTAKIKQLGDIGDNAFLRPDASNLAAFLYLLKERQKMHYANIIDTIKMVAPFFDDFILRPSPFNQDKIKLEWKEKGSNSYFDANALSDGTLRFICLVALLLQPELPELILLDEPELGLHPYAIMMLAGLLRSASKKTQVIVSTQSVTLVDQFTPEDVIVVDREDGQSTFNRPSTEEIASWLDEYSLGELWQKNIIGGRPK